MKADIHPTFHDTVTATCACGATYVVGSTTEAISVEICSACHPFYTGKKNTIDTTGRVDRFKKLAEKAAAKKVVKKPKTEKKAKTEDKK